MRPRNVTEIIESTDPSNGFVLEVDEVRPVKSQFHVGGCSGTTREASEQ